MSTQYTSAPSTPLLHQRGRAAFYALYAIFIVGMVVALAWALLGRYAARAEPSSDALWHDFALVVIATPVIVGALVSLHALTAVALTAVLRTGNGLVGRRRTAVVHSGEAVYAAAIAAVLVGGAALHRGIAVMIVGIALHQLVWRWSHREHLRQQLAAVLEPPLDPATALAGTERALASPGLSAADRLAVLSAHAAYLNDSCRYAESLEALAEIARSRPLDNHERRCWADSVLSAQLTGQRTARPAELLEARDVVQVALQSNRTPAVQHSAAMAALLDGRHEEALTLCRSASKGLARLPVSAGQQSHLRTVRSAEAIAAWRCGQQEAARRILGDLELRDPGGAWTRSLQRIVQAS